MHTFLYKTPNILVNFATKFSRKYFQKEQTKEIKKLVNGSNFVHLERLFLYPNLCDNYWTHRNAWKP